MIRCYYCNRVVHDNRISRVKDSEGVFREVCLKCLGVL